MLLHCFYIITNITMQISNPVSTKYMSCNCERHGTFRYLDKSVGKIIKYT
jgi:hypothetical protein